MSDARRRSGIEIGFLRCKDDDDAVQTLAFYAKLDRMDPEEWLSLWGSQKRIGSRLKAIVDRARAEMRSA